jgi:lipopolysaccharide transport system permease protein
MYASGVVFPVSIFGDKVLPILKWNPILWIVEAIRYSFIGVGSWNWMGLGYAAVILLLLLSIAVIVFNKVEKSFMDTV